MADISQAELDALFASVPEEALPTAAKGPASVPLTPSTDPESTVAAELSVRPAAAPRPPQADVPIGHVIKLLGVSTSEQVRELRSEINEMMIALREERAAIELLRLEVEGLKSNVTIDKILMQMVEIKQELKKRSTSSET